LVCSGVGEKFAVAVEQAKLGVPNMPPYGFTEVSISVICSQP
jgi:hypothetical protein